MDRIVDTQCTVTLLCTPAEARRLRTYVAIGWDHREDDDELTDIRNDQAVAALTEALGAAARGEALNSFDSP